MDRFLNFILNNYIWIFTTLLIVIFALIGFLVDTLEIKTKKPKKKPKK